MSSKVVSRLDKIIVIAKALNIQMCNTWQVSNNFVAFLITIMMMIIILSSSFKSNFLKQAHLSWPLLRGPRGSDCEPALFLGLRNVLP